MRPYQLMRYTACTSASRVLDIPSVTLLFLNSSLKNVPANIPDTRFCSPFYQTKSCIRNFAPAVDDSSLSGSKIQLLLPKALVITSVSIILQLSCLQYCQELSRLIPPKWMDSGYPSLSQNFQKGSCVKDMLKSLSSIHA